MKLIATAALLLAGLHTVTPARAVDVQAYIKNDSFSAIKISPAGDYYAATIPLDEEGKTVLAFMRRSDNAITGTFALGRNTHVEDFQWVNDERVVVSMSEKFGSLDTPAWTGELFAINADGTRAENLVGFRVVGGGLGTNIKAKKAEPVAAYLVDDLPDDDKNVIISVVPFNEDPFTRAERLNVYTGRRTTEAIAPVRNARFLSDPHGVVRFAWGSGVDNIRQLYYRGGAGDKWELIHSEAGTGLMQLPVGFSEDGKVAYLREEHAEGPDSIVSFDVGTQTRKQVLRDDDSDPSRVLYRNGTSVPVGALLHDGKPRTEFFDDTSTTARLYRSLEAAFGGDPVLVTSTTSDGRLALVQTWSDRNPGDFFLYDTIAKKASHVLSRRTWFDPAEMSPTRPIKLSARDGTSLHGYLTAPEGSDGTALPMVVIPHGGPFGEQDTWGFATWPQMLADAGYAVLQVNFRGSGGYGKSFESAGARQWGKAMQDDLTDATRWAIGQGIARSDGICIFGASYGGYAALMGAAREPGLYRCAVGYVGVYDLPTLHTLGDTQRWGSGRNFITEWIGGRDELGASSPNRLADKIKVPVFLAAGGEDQRAPIRHSEMMEKALKDAGVPVETLYYRNEGHGFYRADHQREFYTRLLAFLARNLGGEVADMPAASGDAQSAE